MQTCFRRVVLDLAGMNEEVARDVEISKVLRDLGGFKHRPADDRDLAAVLLGELQRDADAVDGRREAGEEEPALGAREDLVEARADGPFARRVAGAVDVGGVLQQRKDAALAVLSEAGQIEGLAVGRGKIDLEIAGMDHDADRRFDGERDAIDQAVRDAQGLDGEGPEVELALGLNLDELGVVQQLVLFELALDIGKRELRGIDGDIELAQQPGQAADVVFVAVGKDDAAHAGAVFDEVGDVRDDDVDAEQIALRKHQAGVDDEDVFVPANGHAVHAELAKSADGNDLEFAFRHGRKMLAGSGMRTKQDGCCGRQERPSIRHSGGWSVTEQWEAPLIDRDYARPTLCRVYDRDTLHGTAWPPGPAACPSS